MKRRRPRLRKPGVFAGTVGVFAGVVIFLLFVFPYLSKWIVDAPVPLPVPSTLLVWILVIVVAALFVYVTSSSETTREFMAPVKAAVRGEAPMWHRVVARVVAAAVPIAIGGWIFVGSLPRTTPPAVTRQQHPGTSTASAAPYVGMHNPFRRLEGEARERALREGRALYFRNCAPCHGAKHDGEGPAARAQRLKPISFRDPGTIATLVEDAVFWRVNEGWEGLPPVSTPWDSAMPAWHGEMSADEAWKVILSEYEDANVDPRVTGMK